MRILVMMLIFFMGFGYIGQAQTKAERDRERMISEMEKQKEKYISNIINGLDELDEFQKHILSQTLQTYYEELQKIYVQDIPIFQKKTLINDLNAVHFKEFEEMLGEEFVAKVIEKAQGKDQSDQKKKKKKKKKKKE